MIIGDNVILRRIEKDDLPQLWDWHECEELFIFNKIDPLISYDELNEHFEEFFDWKGYFIIETGSGLAFGSCAYSNIFWKNRSCEISFKFYENSVGASQKECAVSLLINFLLNELNMFRIETLIPANLTENVKIIEKLQFNLEGRFREHIYRTGRYDDVLIFALLNE